MQHKMKSNKQLSKLTKMFQTALENINNGVDNGDVDDALTQGKAAIDTIR